MLAIKLSSAKRALLASWISVCLSSGCMLGPNYRTAPSVAVDAINADHLYRARTVVTESVTPIHPWWQSLGDAQLSQLIEQALVHNPSLDVIAAQLDAARALAQQRRAEQLPQLGATALAVRSKAPEWIASTLGRQSAQTGQAARHRRSISSLYDASFDASWELDLFGRLRRAREQARANAEAVAAQRADAQVQLAAEIGQLYINYRSGQARLMLAEKMIEIAQRRMELTRQQAAQGIVSALEIERMKTQLASQQAARVPLNAEQSEILDQLALLVGTVPGALDAQLSVFRPLPSLPNQVAVDDPSAILQRRPDVRQAERELAGSSAQVGQALAQYFPSVSLHGSIGLLATSTAQLGRKALNTALFPLLRWSALDFGRTSAQVDQAKANVSAHEAAYRLAVLAALSDANISLSLFGAARDEYHIAQALKQSALRADALMQQRANVGAANLMDVLDVQRQRLAAEDNALQAQAHLVIRFVALQKSLGLGWSTAAQLPSKPNVSSSQG